MQINYDFPWYIQQSPAFMTLYEGLFDVCSNISPITFIDMLNLDNVEDALIYNVREWAPKTQNPNYYWNGRTSYENFQLMANYIKAKVQMRGQPLSLVTLKRFYETILDGYNYSVADNIEIIESEQHFEIVARVNNEVAQALVEMLYTDSQPFGKPVGISYNITYVLS